ncbi:SDR family NAD(P)-dependent oxidoreductase [Duganella violaceipulchra]|uniref:NAD(P)-dependent dehydrogenase (Short-subunit alcohol dehydrogenase family) n=1 Tax=Duganella violaceipulchra TaxID=2849652 RepID=A0AA41H9S6_9BURK|nr:SDR family NAD(P)-dependent oxidoreductase [Duganella violaceicalia]MBV6323370.1 SDR family NAD(P)-dependent oxidoreductase [Duganella violaceicalia]MCP2007676.1 NAD(P)-dependent dehydrogenase (short-subunit alcohol dehydrogenase family) [Duganella violaceicalia]
MNVMIIGGTSGIGLGLAQHYWRQGARVAICGRHPRKLDGSPLLGEERVSVHVCDIADRAAVARTVALVAADGLDLLIVTAGQYTDAAAIARDPACSLPVLRVNVGGLDHAFSAAAEAMMARGQGRLVAVASIAGLQQDYPGGSLYSASKRAAIAICDAYRKALAPFGIGVTVIVPGYVDTARLRELNNGDASRKPFLMSEQEAVRRIAAAIARRDECCVFPWQMHALVRLFNALPLWLRRTRKK